MSNQYTTHQEELYIGKYTKSGEFICLYSSYEEAQADTGVTKKNIKRVCTFVSKTAGGFQWRVFPEAPEPVAIEPIKVVVTSEKKPVIQRDQNYKFIAEYESISAASASTGISSKSIRSAANGIQKHAGGFLWAFATEEDEAEEEELPKQLLEKLEALADSLSPKVTETIQEVIVSDTTKKSSTAKKSTAKSKKEQTEPKPQKESKAKKNTRTVKKTEASAAESVKPAAESSATKEKTGKTTKTTAKASKTAKEEKTEKPKKQTVSEKKAAVSSSVQDIPVVSVLKSKQLQVPKDTLTILVNRRKQHWGKWSKWNRKKAGRKLRRKRIKSYIFHK